MRAKEFIVEYRRDVTAQAVGDKLLSAAAKDFSYNMSNMIRNDSQMSPATKQAYINDILASIEKRDPTPNKMYSQWLARVYAGGNVRLEDLNRGGLITAYDIGKKRKLIKPEHADINRFKDYIKFEDLILGHYDLDNLMGRDKVEMPKGHANKIYEDSDIRVIVPEDEAAACYYGQGTKWCTAARENNMFDTYHGKGVLDKLYIITPKHPSYTGEKYQFHFETGQFMNEKDQEIDPAEVVEQYPSLAIALKDPVIKAMTVKLMPPEVAEKIYQTLASVITRAKVDLLSRVDNPELQAMAANKETFKEDYEQNLEFFREYAQIDYAVAASIRDFKRGLYGWLSTGEAQDLSIQIEEAIDAAIAELIEKLPDMY